MNNFIKQNWVKELLAMVCIVMFGLFFYGATLRGAVGNPVVQDFKNNLDQNTRPFELSPERGRFVHVMALGDNHTYALDESLALVAYPDVGFHGDKFFSFFQPGIPYMALPFYLLGKQVNLSQVFSFGFISLISIFSLLFLYKISRKVLGLPIWAALFAVMVFAFGSSAWSYAITLYQHHVTVFFMLSGFYAVWKFSQNAKFSWAWALWAGLAYGLSITIDSPNAILLSPVALYLIITAFSLLVGKTSLTVKFKVSALWGLFGFVAAVGLLLYFNQHYFGSWKTLAGALPSWKGQAQQVATSTVSALDVPVEKNVVGFFKEQSVPKGFVTLLASQDRGLFFFVPIMLLSLFGIYKVLRRGAATPVAILLLFVAINILLYSSWGDPWGGWAYGPRYLIPSMSVFAIFVAVAVFELRAYWWFKFLTLILFAFSSWIALLGALTTNANPAKSEALALHTGDNFFRNWTFLQDGKSGSFVYNTFFFHSVDITHYFFVLFGILLTIAAVVLFVLPRKEEHGD